MRTLRDVHTLCGIARCGNCRGHRGCPRRRLGLLMRIGWSSWPKWLNWNSFTQRFTRQSACEIQRMAIRLQ